MKRLLVLSVVPFVLLACGRGEPPAGPGPLATSPGGDDRAETARAESGRSSQALQPLQPGAHERREGMEGDGAVPARRSAPAGPGPTPGDSAAARGEAAYAGRLSGPIVRGEGSGIAAMDEPRAGSPAPAGSPAEGTAGIDEADAADDTGEEPDAPAAGAGTTSRGAGGSPRAAGIGARDEHLVKPGDTLFGIARRNGVEVAQLLRWNPDLDPRRLRVGQAVRLAPADGAASGSRSVAARKASQVSEREYTVARGDTMFSIARELGVSLADLRAWNPQVDPRRLRVGQTLLVAPAS